MAGYSAAIEGATLNTLLEDPAHMASFASYVADELVGTNHIEMVPQLDSLQRIKPLQQQMGNKDRRSSRVAQNAPTPKGNTTLADFRVICQEFRFAEPMSVPRGKSLNDFMTDVAGWLRDSAGHQVKIDVEDDLMAILRGNGTDALKTSATVQDLATGTKYWDGYANATHDPIKDIMIMQRRTGASEIFMGSDVALTLLRSPILTGSSAGGGREFITYGQLIDTLNGIGFARVIIGNQFYQQGPKEYPSALKLLHDGVCAMWSPGALKKYSFEPYQYDSYQDPDTRQDYYRALETAVFKAPYKEAVGVFQNCLENAIAP
jgi:hypothetical protein